MENKLWAQYPSCPPPPSSLTASATHDFCSNTAILTATPTCGSPNTTDYVLSNISYTPHSYTTGIDVGWNTANPTPVNDDDFSTVIPIGFNFCFMGQIFTDFIVSTEGYITFDMVYANPPGASFYNPNANGGFSQQNYAIMCPVQDLNPSLGGTVKYELAGTAPCRNLTISWHQIPMQQCPNILCTQQIVIYESTNVIQTFIESKPICGGQVAFHGLADASWPVNTWVVPGRNHTSWAASNDAWQFTPNGCSTSMVVWTDDTGVVLGTGSPLIISPIVSPQCTATVVFSGCTGSSISSAVVTIPNFSFFVDLELTQLINTPPIMVNGNGIYSFTVTNHGNVPVSQVQVQSNIPCGSYLSHTSTGNAAYAASGLYTIPTIPPNGSVTVTVTFLYTVANSACEICSSIVNYDDMIQYPDCNPNNQSACNILQPLDINIQVFKSIDATNLDLNGIATFTITVINTSNNIATDVLLQEIVPTCLENVTINPPPGATVTGSNILIPSVPANNVGNPITFTVTGTYINGIAECTNCVQFVPSANQTDTNPNDNYACGTIPPLDVNILLYKYVDNPNPSIGDLVTYAIFVQNTGTDDAINVAIQEALPACLANVSILIIPGQVLNGTTVTILSLGAGQITVFHVVGTYINGAEDCENCVYYTPVSGLPDSNPEDNHSCTEIAHIETDLALTKQIISQDSVAGTITFQIAVTNLGGVDANDVILHDVWGTSCFTYVSSFLPKPGSTITLTSVPYQYTSSADIYLPEVVAGTTEYFEITYHKDALCTDCENCVSLLSFNGVDTNHNNNTQCVTLSANLPTGTITISGAPNSMVDMTIDYLGTNSTNMLTIIVEPFVTWRVQGSRELQFCEVILLEGAKILIPKSHRLQINSSHLHGCIRMWNEIDVEESGRLEIRTSIIEDARYAVHFRNGAAVYTKAPIFRRNYVSIYIEPSQSLKYLENTYYSGLPFLNILDLQMVTFSCPTPMLPPFAGQTPSVNDAAPNRAYSFAGIEMHDVEYLFGNSTPNPLNHNVTYSSLNNGILAYRSDIHVRYQYFIAIYPHDQQYPGTFQGWNDHDGSAVYALGKKGTGHLHFYGYGKLTPPSMIQVKYGVYSQLMKATQVENTHMSSATVGVHIRGSYQGTHKIHDNGFYCGSFGVQTSFNDQSFVEIHDNYFDMNDAYFGFPGQQYLNNSAGIAAFDMVPTTLKVHDNEIDLDDCLVGIGSFVTPQGAEIKHNIVNMNGANSAVGVCAYLSPDIDIECNQVFGDYGTGYGEMYCDNSKLHCNSAENVPTGFLFFGPNNNTDFSGNFMNNNTQHGLHIHPNSYIGAQINTGNMWIGTWGGGIVMAQNDGNANLSKFFVNPFGTPIIGSLPFTPPNRIPSGIGWFNNASVTDILYDCIANSVCGSGPLFPIMGGSDSTITSTDEKIALDSLEFEGYEEDMQLQAEHYLYQKLDKEPDLVENNSIMEDFYDEKSETNIKDFTDIHKAMASYTIQNPAKDSIWAYIGQIKEDIAIQDSLLQYATTFADTLLILSSKATLWESVSEADSLLRLILTTEDSLKSLYADSIKMVNNGIFTSRDMEDNEKTVNRIYLETIAKGVFHFDENQKADLESIIYQCPLAGGTAVFKARSLYSLINGQFMYDDTEFCNLVNMEWRIAHHQETKVTELENTVVVYPNPTTGEINFHFGTATSDLSILHLYNAQGQEVFTQTIGTETETIAVDLSMMVKGIYLYRISGNSTYSGKIILQ